MLKDNKQLGQRQSYFPKSWEVISFYFLNSGFHCNPFCCPETPCRAAGALHYSPVLKNVWLKICLLGNRQMSYYFCCLQSLPQPDDSESFPKLIRPLYLLRRAFRSASKGQTWRVWIKNLHPQMSTTRLRWFSSSLQDERRLCCKSASPLADEDPWTTSSHVEVYTAGICT